MEGASAGTTIAQSRQQAYAPEYATVCFQDKLHNINLIDHININLIKRNR